MVWTAGKVETLQFAYLMIPSLVNWIVPALCMYFFIPDEVPESPSDKIKLKPGAIVIVIMGICTIATAVSFHQFFHLPPFLGMMLGLAALMLFGYYLKRWEKKKWKFPKVSSEKTATLISSIK